MLSRRLPLARILHPGRPPRPCNPTKSLPNPRRFTQSYQPLLVSGVNPRPQLPFLHPVAGTRPPPIVPRTQSQHQINRFLTTETKLYLKDQIWKAAKWTFYGWAGFVLLVTMAFGIHSERVERWWPSPPEWTFLSRDLHRVAKAREHPDPSDHNSSGLIDWAGIGCAYLALLRRLEDPSKDGQGLRPILQEEGDLYVAAIGKAGLDISLKSEPWKRGYYACLIGLAKAAENLDGWVRDTKSNTAFPPEVIVGPSNPRPKPLPYGLGTVVSAPFEENCVPALEPAETFYTKILTTHGFNSGQSLHAALAYADWLDYKGLSSTAEEMYDWALDIATGALPVGINNVVDIKSGVINSNATYISTNILLATTSLARHHARNNNLATALPIFLSVLRARRQLPDSFTLKPEPKSQSQSSIDTLVSLFKSLLGTPPYPPEPPTGDEMASRTPAAICEEAGVMAHIGEILFASSSTSSYANIPSNTNVEQLIPATFTTNQLKNQQAGLSWTRDAVDLAEATIMSADKDDDEARAKCSECLAVGMENWSTMISKLIKDERQAGAGRPMKPGSSWYWGGGATNGDKEGRWEQEARLVDERLRSVRKLIMKEEERKDAKANHFT